MHWFAKNAFNVHDIVNFTMNFMSYYCPTAVQNKLDACNLNLIVLHGRIRVT